MPDSPAPTISTSKCSGAMLVSEDYLVPAVIAGLVPGHSDQCFVAHVDSSDMDARHKAKHNEIMSGDVRLFTVRPVQFVSRLKPNQKIPINVLLTAIVSDRAIDVVGVRGLAGGSSRNWLISIMSSVAMRLLRANTASVSATRAFCFGAAGCWAADPAGCSVIGCGCGSGAEVECPYCSCRLLGS